MTNPQLDTTNESQEVSPFPTGDHKAYINRRAQRHSKHKTKQKHKKSTKEVPPWKLRSVIWWQKGTTIVRTMAYFGLGIFLFIFYYSFRGNIHRLCHNFSILLIKSGYWSLLFNLQTFKDILFSCSVKHLSSSTEVGSILGSVSRSDWLSSVLSLLSPFAPP